MGGSVWKLATFHLVRKSFRPQGQQILGRNFLVKDVEGFYASQSTIE